MSETCFCELTNMFLDKNNINDKHYRRWRLSFIRGAERCYSPLKDLYLKRTLIMPEESCSLIRAQSLNDHIPHGLLLVGFLQTLGLNPQSLTCECRF